MSALWIHVASDVGGVRSALALRSLARALCPHRRSIEGSKSGARSVAPSWLIPSAVFCCVGVLWRLGHPVSRGSLADSALGDAGWDASSNVGWAATTVPSLLGPRSMQSVHAGRSNHRDGCAGDRIPVRTTRHPQRRRTIALGLLRDCEGGQQNTSRRRSPRHRTHGRDQTGHTTHDTLQHSPAAADGQLR